MIINKEEVNRIQVLCRSFVNQIEREIADLDNETRTESKTIKDIQANLSTLSLAASILPS